MDIEQPNELLNYLRHRGYIETADSCRVERLKGGVSNRTMLVRRPQQPNWVIKQALPQLRVKVDWFCNPARILRESAGLRVLQNILEDGAVPRFVFDDAEHFLLGMTAVREPHENWKSVLLNGQIDTRLVAQAADMLAAIHSHACQLPTEQRLEFEERSFYEALRLEPYYGYTSRQVPDGRYFLTDLMEETRARQDTLVHGDFSPKNILVQGRELILLDHEVIHWGDCSFDCGFFLAHLLSKAHHRPTHRDQFLSAALSWTARYCERVRGQFWADNLECRIVRHTLGCLLARVRGRSQLEYLSEAERSRQAKVVVALMREGCDNFRDLSYQFVKLLG